MDKRIKIFKRISSSIFTGSNSLNGNSKSGRARLVFRSLILHLHPQFINKNALKFNRTFGLGGMAIILICIQFITGLLLRFFYEPFPGRAYESIHYLQQNIMFGQFIRNLHHWSAVFLIIITFLHLLRVYFTGAFHGMRQFNWVIGVTLLLLIVLSNFTGYLLPWDQLSYWAVTVSANMLDYIPLIGPTLKEILQGGAEVGSSTLIIFYNLHTGIFPILIILIMAFHFWRVRKAGGVTIPQEENTGEFVPVIPNLVAKEFVVALVLIASIFVLALLFNAPLLEKANPGFSPNPSKSPWYFAGIQELILHFHPLFGAVIIPLVVLSLLLLLPYFIYPSDGKGIWFYSEKAKKMGINAVIYSALITIAMVLLDEYIIDINGALNFIPEIISHCLIPFFMIISGLILYYLYMVKRLEANKNEAFQTLFVFVLTAFLILTITGIYFRGEGMILTF